MRRNCGAHVGLSDLKLLFFHGGYVDNFCRQLAIDDFAVGRFKKAVGVDPSVNGHGVDQTDIGPFWGFHRADAPIVGRVDVANFDSGTISG